MKRAQVPIAVYMLAVFISGGLVGAFAHRLYTVHTVVAAPPRLSPAEFRQKYVREMQDKLKLDEGQTARLDQILKDTHQKFEALRVSHRPQVEAIREEQKSNIRAMLNASQQAEYEKVLQEQERRKKAEKGSRP